MAISPLFKFYFQNSCDNVPVSTFTPSNNGGKQAFTVTGYNISKYLDQGDELAFIYSGNYYVYTVIDITGNQLTMSFDYNPLITNVNTYLQFSIKTAANPLDFYRGKFIWEKDKDNFFYRLSYSGKVTFNKLDYNYLKFALDDDCCRVSFKVFKLCGGVYTLLYRSNINRTEGLWNESKCLIETSILPVDKYACITSQSDIEKDIYNSPLQLAVVLDDDNAGGFTQGPFYEYLVRANPPVAPGSTHVSGPGALWSQVNGTGGYASDPNTGNPWTLYVREVRVATYIGDPLSFVTPVTYLGAGLTSEIRIDNKIIARYTNQVLPGDAPEYDSYVYGTGGNCEFESLKTFAIYDPINDNCIYTQPVFTAGLVTTTYETRLLSQVLTTLITGCNNIQGITSDFFEINPIGDTLGYTAGENYLTASKNYVNNLRVSGITNVTNPAGQTTEVNVKFADFMKQLNVMFNVYWFIDSANRLRIEHLSWFNNTLIANVSNENLNKFLKEYLYFKEDAPSREAFKFLNAGNTDFKGTDIVYPESCSSGLTVTKEAGNVTTDIHYLRNTDVEYLKNTGIVIFACKYGTNQVLREPGKITGITLSNNHLSWANLHYNYHLYGRSLPTGLMNYIDTSFITWIKRRKQINQRYLGCCLSIPETNGTVITQVGTGTAIKITFDIHGPMYEFELEI